MIIILGIDQKKNFKMEKKDPILLVEKEIKLINKNELRK